MFSTDEDTLVLHVKESGDEYSLKIYKRIGWAQFTYGNDGYDVLSDHTANLEPLMATITAYQTKHGF